MSPGGKAALGFTGAALLFALFVGFVVNLFTSPVMDPTDVLMRIIEQQKKTIAIQDETTKGQMRTIEELDKLVKSIPLCPTSPTPKVGLRGRR